PLTAGAGWTLAPRWWGRGTESASTRPAPRRPRLWPPGANQGPPEPALPSVYAAFSVCRAFLARRGFWGPSPHLMSWRPDSPGPTGTSHTLPGTALSGGATPDLTRSVWRQDLWVWGCQTSLVRGSVLVR